MALEQDRKPVSFRDVEDLRLGAEARTRDSAEQMIEQHADQEEQQLAAEEESINATDNGSLREDALLAIEHLQEVDDPEAELAKLPPVLQEEIKNIIDSAENENQEEVELPAENIQQVEDQPVEPSMGLIKPIDDNIQAIEQQTPVALPQ